jgi:magnesium chelatase subunit I
LEQIAFEARRSEFVDAKSGVSTRMSITAYENLISTAERRLLITHDSNTSIRMGDFLGIITAMIGKIELVYEGEQEGSNEVAFQLITNAIKTLFPSYFPKIEKLEKPNETGPYDALLEWFFKENELFIEDDTDEKNYQNSLGSIPAIKKIIKKAQPQLEEKDYYFMAEFLLWGLEAHQKLNKLRTLEGTQFKDSLGSFINRL